MSKKFIIGIDDSEDSLEPLSLRFLLLKQPMFPFILFMS